MKKFKVWDYKEKKFDYFELSNITVGEYRLSYERLYQFIGIWDKNMKEIYENDVVQFDKHEGTAVGVVQYFPDYCSYALDSDIGVVPFMHIDLQSLEVIGNKDQDYVWDETGSKLIKKVALS